MKYWIKFAARSDTIFPPTLEAEAEYNHQCAIDTETIVKAMGWQKDDVLMSIGSNFEIKCFDDSGWLVAADFLDEKGEHDAAKALRDQVTASGGFRSFDANLFQPSIDV